MTYPTHEYVLPFVERGFRAFEAVKESTEICKRNEAYVQQASTAAFPDLVVRVIRAMSIVHRDFYLTEIIVMGRDGESGKASIAGCC
jgi:hypothetical protein